MLANCEGSEPGGSQLQEMATSVGDLSKFRATLQLGLWLSENTLGIMGKEAAPVSLNAGEVY